MKQLIALLFIAMLAIGFVPAGAFADEHDNSTNSTDDDMDDDLGDVGDDTDTGDDDADDTSGDDDTTDDDAAEDDTESGDDDADDTGDDSSDDEQETEDDVKDMQTGLGAEMRLTQLEKQLVRAQTHAQEIIARIAEQNGTANLSNLEAIEAEFGIMIVEVQDARAALAEDNNTENAVKVFVALVHDARDLTKRFREEARSLIRAEDREALKERLERAERARLAELEERIKNARRAYNAEQARRMLERAGSPVNEDVIRRIRAGDIDADDIRERVKMQVRELTPEEREEAVARLREEAARARVAALARLEKAQRELNDIDARYEERIRLAEEKGLVEVREKLEVKQGRAMEVKQKLEVREDGVKTRIESRVRTGDDKDDSTELEVEADVYTDVTIVEVEWNDKETTFRTAAKTREEVVNEVARKFGIDRARVDAALDFEIEDEASTDDDSESDMNDDDEDRG